MVLGLVEWLKQEIVNLREREPIILMDDINNILDEGVKQIKWQIILTVRQVKKDEWKNIKEEVERFECEGVFENN